MRNSTSDFEKYKDSKILVCDINSSMLQVGKERYKKMHQKEGLIEFPKLEFLEQNAEDLKDIPDNTFDLYTISFGIRNVPK